MEMRNIPFGTTNWSEIVPAAHGGETGMANRRTQRVENIRVRMVEYSAGYLADALGQVIWAAGASAHFSKRI